MKKRIAVIGGGLGGLAAAARCAASGADVHLYEKNEKTGGRLNRLEFDGFTFDSGPVLLTLPSVMEELWAFCNQDYQDYFQLQPLNPIFRYFLPNGSTFETYSDLEALKFQISKLPEHNIRDFVDFLNYSKRLYKIFTPLMFNQAQRTDHLYKNDFLGKFLLNVRHAGLFRSVHNKVQHYFQDSPLVHIFDRYSIALGSNPYQAPAILNLFPWMEYGFGSYYISGGMYQLVKGLEALCRSLGVHIYTSAPVEKLQLLNNRAATVQVNGESIAVDSVISNTEPLYTLKMLVGKDAATGLHVKKPSPSGMVFLWGVRGETRQFDHLNLVLSKNPEVEYAHVFDHGHISDDPTIQVSITSKLEQDHAKKGCENWCVLVKMPFLKNKNWTPTVNQLRGLIFSRLKSVDVDLHGRIESEHVFTPAHFENRYNCRQGNLFGVALDDLASFWRGRANTAKHIRGLYFCGSSVHPGCGIPLCLLSGKMAAELAMPESAS